MRLIQECLCKDGMNDNGADCSSEASKRLSWNGLAGFDWASM